MEKQKKYLDRLIESIKSFAKIPIGPYLDPNFNTFKSIYGNSFFILNFLFYNQFISIIQ